MHSITVHRATLNRVGDDKILKQLNHIMERALDGSRARFWTCRKESVQHGVRENGKWNFRYRLVFKKDAEGRGNTAREWEQIQYIVQKTGHAAAYKDFPWETVAINNVPTIEDVAPVSTHTLPPEEFFENRQIYREPEFDKPENFSPTVDINPDLPADFKDIIKGMTNIVTGLAGYGDHPKEWSELQVPSELLGVDSDYHLAQHPIWKKLYGVNPQIRIILSNIQRAAETEGEVRNHVVLFGHSGCGKTTTMNFLEEMVGSENVLKLDATSTTKAGLEKLFFGEELRRMPKLVFMEEAEKANVEALKIWLGALDERSEIRKINARTNQFREIKVLFVCSVNNKSVFDKMMGSDGTQVGAFSSRCATQIYYPRPTEAQLYHILEKEIMLKGGEIDWIRPAIKLATEMEISDPRIVKSFLAGGDRLLNGLYQKDWKAVYEAQKGFNK